MGGRRPVLTPSTRLPWERRLDRVLGFIEERGSLPRADSAEARDESSDGYWLLYQKKKLDMGTLSDEHAKRLREAHPLLAERLQGWIREGRRSRNERTC